MTIRVADSVYRGERGFLLIEMLVILTILGISLLGILSQSSTAVRGNRRADQGSVATALAQAKLEELKAHRFAAIAGGSDDGSLAADGESGAMYRRSWQVTPEVVNGVAAKRIRVDVSWHETAGTPVVALSTLVVDVPSYAANYPTVVEHTWRRE